MDRPVIIPVGIRWEKHPYTAREPSMVQGALVRWMYPEPIGPENDRRPVLTWEDYKVIPNPGVRSAASKIKEEFWWHFKCDPSNQEKIDAVLEENFTEKVRQMLFEEKKAALKRLAKNGKVPTESYEDGNKWPTMQALISAKPADFATVEGWRLLCQHWSTPEFRKKSLNGKRNRLAHGETVFHCSGARSIVSTRQFLKRKIGKDPGLSGAYLHTHKLHRGTNHEQLCSQRASENWEKLDNAMALAHGEIWEEEHPDLDAQIIYETTGRVSHGRLGIANEAFSKGEKSLIKSTRWVSQPVRSAREDRLERENNCLLWENSRLRGIELIVRSLAEKGGLDFDVLMQSAAPDMSTTDSEVGFARGGDASNQHITEPGMGSNAGGSHNDENGISGDEHDMSGEE